MSAEAVSAFIDRHLFLLSQERNVEVERTSLASSKCGPKLLEQKGLALNGLGIASISVGLGNKTLIELERPAAYHTITNFPPHTFRYERSRPGDLASIEENVASTGRSKKSAKSKGVPVRDKIKPAIDGVVYKVSDSRIIIAIDSSRSDLGDFEFPERCRVLKLANSTTFDRKVLVLVASYPITFASTSNPKGAPRRSPLTEVLLGMAVPSRCAMTHDISFFDSSLNDSQKAAVRFALESVEVACIHGPPGSGKTHTLIEIIRQLTSITLVNPRPLRLLVCGASNLSVDNILERLLALSASSQGSRLNVTRIGHPARVIPHEGALNSTLEAQAERSDEAALARDVKIELEAALGILSGKGKGGKVPRGLERKKMWEETHALRKEYRQRERSIGKAVLQEAQVVLATCHSSGGHQLRMQEFDVVIIDEATQALEAVCWIPIFKAKKLILAGDPKQLPPTVRALSPTQDLASRSKSRIASRFTSKMASSVRCRGLMPPRTLELTMFERLEKMYGPRIKYMLTVQYRMHAKIAEFPSKVMYDSRLITHSSVATHLLRHLPGITATSEDLQDILEAPITFFDTAGCEYFERVEGDDDEGSRCNENEATIVHKWVATLVAAGITSSQIGIITPYQAQVVLLTSLLRSSYGPELEIGTVDGMQGREKEAVIISLVRSNDKREVGFLKDERRLNVAMTRARRHLCVVGDSSTVQHGSKYLKDWVAWLEDNADIRFPDLD
ncbi:P-loop containing nucleoside triphosphate hydrolase protein [Russula brevipes]|nr:P-loop containing nucleoside triphosphate hydrolase protein [Russula brevipes]